MTWLRIYVLIGLAIAVAGICLGALGVGERADTWNALVFVGFSMAIASAIRATVKDTPND